MENHFSYRTRLMDAIWSGLPTVCTRDGFIADWLEDIGGGITVPESDPQALADAILEGLQPDRHTAMKDALLANRHQFYWSECVKPLEAYCKKLEDNPRIPPTKIAGCLAYLTYKVQAWYALKIEPRLRPRK
jgi:glycosyltransferase involved in cell wall biosynthesis